MTLFNFFEILLIAIIVYWQWKSFNATKETIKELNSVLPPVINCRIAKITREIPTEERFYYLIKFFSNFKRHNLLRDLIIENVSSKEISGKFKIEDSSFDDLTLLENPSIDESVYEFYNHNAKAIELNLRKKPPFRTEEFYRISYDKQNETIQALNKYLEKNKGAVADFSLLRDIAQRNIDVFDDEINLTLQTPLFLGLAGTMLGIIIGVLSLYFSGSGALIGQGAINTLLSSVGLAMIASLAGLGFTTWNSAVNFKGAKIAVEKNKNKFFTFLQTELIPVLSENVTTGIIGLNKNIERFGESFRKDVVQLEVMINKNHDSLVAQQKTIEALDGTNFKKVIGFNLDIFKQLTNSMGALERLSASLQNVDNLVTNSAEIVKRTQDVGNISQRLVEVIDLSKNLQLYLQRHFSDLEARGQIINDTVGAVDDAIGKSLEELRSFTEAKINAVKSIQFKEEDLLANQLANKREQESKIKSLEAYVAEFKQFASDDSKTQRKILDALDRNNNLLSTVLQKGNNGKGGGKTGANPKVTVIKETSSDVESEPSISFFKKLSTGVKGIFLRISFRKIKVENDENVSNSDSNSSN